MAKAFNPFEHHHPHHDHDHDHDQVHETLDPGQESLRDALRVSFFLLKIVMLGLAVWYLFSNFHIVQAQEVAVRLRFGEIVGDTPEDRIERAGMHFGWPYPIEQVIRIDMTPRTMDFQHEFFFDIPEGTTRQTLEMNESHQLNPERDGYLVTGDAGIVHLRLTVRYNVGRDESGQVSPQRVVHWVEHVGSEADERALVRLAVERALVHHAAQRPADALIAAWTETDDQQLRRLMQQTLDGAASGLVVTEVTVSDRTPPPAVKRAFDLVTQAQSQREAAIAGAQQERTRILAQAGGPAHQELWARLQAYQRAYVDPAVDAAALRDELSTQIKALRLLRTQDDGTVVEFPITGDIASLMYEAQTYSAGIERRWRGEAERFRTLLIDQYQRLPRLTVTRLEQDLRRAVLHEGATIFFQPPGKPILQIGVDPRQQEERQREAATPTGTAGVPASR